MTAKQMLPIIPDNIVVNKIYGLRGLKVMLDSDLAELYGVETKRVNEQVGRNPDRFPEDFMFQLTDEEWLNLKSQFATSSWGGTRKLPYVFTEHGILQLSNVLKSERATQMSIKIIEVFIEMREYLIQNLSLRNEIEEIRKKLNNHDKNIELVFSYLDELTEKKENERERVKIGYKK